MIHDLLTDPGAVLDGPAVWSAMHAWQPIGRLVAAEVTAVLGRSATVRLSHRRLARGARDIEVAERVFSRRSGCP
ncbi:hypothetical protein Ppa06_42830 [Planomonospora parontospora subsp. parontospora]|uniref:Uncharacterized protein n=2 Tax=Planomonospora parontospora TaxID=58119 RepID=A0AA37F6D9_9ACTN|nr:hypothetical protein [Planomonospora parontospora]GGK83654.1 hypothetical protein GCM10010126_48680 [Planomonospora parontospora]GII10485.1 hypothetical protein Ppa06_42830 [Planomonospora parontospora subsp. parontospora]